MGTTSYNGVGTYRILETSLAHWSLHNSCLYKYLATNLVNHILLAPDWLTYLLSWYKKCLNLSIQLQILYFIKKKSRYDIRHWNITENCYGLMHKRLSTLHLKSRMDLIVQRIFHHNNRRCATNIIDRNRFLRGRAAIVARKR